MFNRNTTVLKALVNTIQYAKLVMKKPHYVLEYLTRERNLARILKVERKQVHDALQECKHLHEMIYEELKRFPYMGYMTKRTYEIIYAIVRILNLK
jgi:hypothetical protein